MVLLNEYARYLISKENLVFPLASKVETAYRCIEKNFKLDPFDQVHFVAALYHAVQYFQPTHVIQTGTCTGVSLMAMLIAASDSGKSIHITSIDPEPDYYAFSNQPVRTARLVVRQCGFDRYVNFVKGYSGTAPPCSPLPGNLLLSFPPSFDMLVVDGDHSFKGAYTDLTVGYDTLRGDKPIIFVHDYNSIPEVRAAVDLWLNRSGLVFQAFKTEKPCGLAIIQVFNKNNKNRRN